MTDTAVDSEEFFDLSPEEEAELQAAIAEADADPSAGMPADEFMRWLRAQ
jgi:hypothetical protein